MKTPESFLKDNGFTLAKDINRAGLIATFLSEMEKGLAGAESSLRMIPTYCTTEKRIPQGAKVAVLDAGGTNFRSGIVSIPPKIEDRANQPMPGTKNGVTDDEFYNAFANEVLRVIGGATADRIGFCFSYNCDATPDLDAKLNCWTKGIRAPGIVGQYVGSELSKRIGGRKLAVVNDTVATLLAAKATEGDSVYSSYLGFILGTGTNVAYVEKNANITKLSGLDPSGAMIINAESGSFDKIERSKFDEAMDARQIDPGHNVFEKMISGGYLGPVGLEVFRAAAKAGFFSPEATNRLAGLMTLETRDLSEFCANYRDKRVNPLYDVFSSKTDQKIACRLGLPVFDRAAILTAVHLAAFVIKTGEGVDAERPVAINADGSTYYKTMAIPFAEIVKRELHDLLTVQRNVYFEITPQVEDAPMVGAAIAALM